MALTLGIISGSLTSQFSGSFTGSYTGDGSQLTNLPAGTTPTLQQVTDQGSVTTNPITASGDISLPGSGQFINFVANAAIYSRTGGSYPGLQIASGDGTNARIWLGDQINTAGPVTASFIGLGKITNVATIEPHSNYPFKIRGGAGPNDVNDGIQMYTNDDSNDEHLRFEIEADADTVDAYFTNINGLGINQTSPSATLDVSGNINTTSHITASGNVSGSATSTSSFGHYIGDGSQLTNIPSPSGKIGIADANGAYTYYSTLSASLQSATEGDTIELFANVTENWGTSDPETHLKNNVNFNFNGHTYFFTGSKNAGGITCLTDNSVAISCSFYNGRIQFKEDEVGSGNSNHLLTVGSQGSRINFNAFEVENLHQDASPVNYLILNLGTIVGGTYIARSNCATYLFRNTSTSTTEKAFLKNANIFYYGTTYAIYNYYSAVLSNCNIYYEGGSTAVYQGNFSGMLKDSSIYCKSGNGVIGGEVVGCNIHVVSGYGHDQTTSGGITPKTINTYIEIVTGDDQHDGIKATYDVSNVHIVHNDDGGGHGIELNGSAVRVNGAIIVGRDWGSSYPLHINASNTVISNASIRSTYPASSQTAVYIASGVTNSTLLNSVIEVAGSGGTHIGITAADDDTEVKYSHIQFLNKSSGTLTPVNETKIKQTMGSTSDPYGNIVIE